MDTLQDNHQHITPIITGEFNVDSWLSYTHSSAAGTATKDFSDSRGLFQHLDSTCGNAILDLVFYGHQGSIQLFPAFKTSYHLVQGRIQTTFGGGTPFVLSQKS